MRKSPAYKIGEELFKVGVEARRKVEQRHDGTKPLLRYVKSLCGIGQYAAWLAIGEYVEKNFRRKKK